MFNSLAARCYHIGGEFGLRLERFLLGKLLEFLWTKMMAPLPLDLLGPTALDHLMTTGIQDVDLMTNMHEVPFYFKFHVNNAALELLIGSITFGATSNILVFNKLVRIHCKTGGLSARLVFETRAKCLDFVDWYKDDGISNEVGSPFCSVKTNIAVCQSKSLEDREIGKRFAPLWEILAAKLKVFIPEGDDTGTLHCPCTQHALTSSHC